MTNVFDDPDEFSRHSSASFDLNEESNDETKARHYANDVRNLDCLLTNMNQESMRRKKSTRVKERSRALSSAAVESSHGDDNLSWKIFPTALHSEISADRSPLRHQIDASEHRDVSLLDRMA